MSATYLVAWRRVDELAAATSHLAWLLGVAFRVLSNERRSRRRRRRLERRAEQLHLEVPAPRPDRIVADRADLERVLEAFATLSPFDQELVRLVAFERLEYAEIAEAHDLTVAAVRSRLHRARARLRGGAAAHGDKA